MAQVPPSLRVGGSDWRRSLNSTFPQNDGSGRVAFPIARSGQRHMHAAVHVSTRVMKLHADLRDEKTQVFGNCQAPLALMLRDIGGLSAFSFPADFEFVYVTYAGSLCTQ